MHCIFSLHKSLQSYCLKDEVIWEAKLLCFTLEGKGSWVPLKTGMDMHQALFFPHISSTGARSAVFQPLPQAPAMLIGVRPTTARKLLSRVLGALEPSAHNSFVFPCSCGYLGEESIWNSRGLVTLFSFVFSLISVAQYGGLLHHFVFALMG